jgi:hypothetical protein
VLRGVRTFSAGGGARSCKGLKLLFVLADVELACDGGCDQTLLQFEKETSRDGNTREGYRWRVQFAYETQPSIETGADPRL